MRYFVIRGFGTKKDSAGRPIDFDQVDAQLIQPALARCGFAGGTTGEIVDAGNIREDMFALILEADVVVCDITVHNANVFYELGVRHALRKKHTVLIKGQPSADTTPFDLATDRYLPYPVDDPGASVDALVAAIESGVHGNRATDSPIFLLLPGLPEADPSKVSVLPIDFIEEVERAEAAADKGWLRVIAEDVRGERFQRDGLKKIAGAQWRLKDYAGARASWEAVRAVRPQDLEANLALANIYERLYRVSTRPELLEMSNQALRTVLELPALNPEQRAEAMALQGRNLKTLWTREFRGLPTLDERRAKALDARLMQSYEAYQEAFRADLNAFFPGVAGLQLGVILQSLAAAPGWRNLFQGNKRAADRYREDLEDALERQRHVVEASVERTLDRAQGEALKWARITQADLLFLAGDEAALDDDPSVLVASYRAAIPANDRFAWDAARGTLALFAELGIRARAAQAVMAALDGPPQPAVKTHLIVCTGHVVDPPQATSARFPARAEARARELIRERLREHQRRDLEAGEQTVVLASAAPGTDILVHEVCRELGLSCWLCLPMRREVVAQLVFGELDAWRDRFFAVAQAQEAHTLVLHDSAEVPRWLRARSAERRVDPWERGGRWVLQLAQTWDAGRKTLLALWDGQADAGGTAQMVRLARQTGAMSVDPIDAKLLLEG